MHRAPSEAKASSWSPHTLTHSKPWSQIRANDSNREKSWSQYGSETVVPFKDAAIPLRDEGANDSNRQKSWSQYGSETVVPFKDADADGPKAPHLSEIQEDVDEAMARPLSPRDLGKCGTLLTTWKQVDDELEKCNVPYPSDCA